MHPASDAVSARDTFNAGTLSALTAAKILHSISHSGHRFRFAYESDAGVRRDGQEDGVFTFLNSLEDVE